MSALALPLLLALAAQGGGPLALRYELSAREVQLGEVLQLDVVLLVEGRGQIEELALPDFAPAFSVVRETRAEVRAGGRVELRFVYALRAELPGDQRIGEASARMGRSTARAAPVTVRVLGEANQGSGSAAAPGSQPGARFSGTPPAAFLEVTADQASPWVGQQIVVTTTVYSQQPLAQVPRLPGVKPPGFLCVSLTEEGKAINPTRQTIKGRSYYVYELHQDALFPLEEGQKTVAALSVEVVPAGSLFSASRSLAVRSAPLTLDVKPLPTEGRPARFSPGNIGIWQIEATVRPATVKLGQPFSLVVVVSGRGSLESLQLPSWDGGGRARVFPAQARIERHAGAQVAGRVVVETLVQPSEVGELRVPSLSFASFDPEAGRYVEARTAPLIVKVTGASDVARGPAASERRAIAKAARPLKPRARAARAPGEGPVLAGAFMALAGGVGWALLRARTRRTGSLAGTTRKRREQRARALAQASARGDLAALERALLDALAERAGDDVRGLPAATLAERLTERGLPAGLAGEVVSLIHQLEAARFAPSGGGEARRLGEGAVALVRQLEAST